MAILAILYKTLRRLETADSQGEPGDVPLGWHIPPEQFAPDSSDSDYDTESSAPVTRYTAKVGRRSLTVLGWSTPGHDRSESSASARSWTEFKRQRQRLLRADTQ